MKTNGKSGRITSRPLRMLQYETECARDEMNEGTRLRPVAQEDTAYA